MSLTYAIADLHGRFDLLTAAFSDIFKDAILRGGAGEQFKIVTLGDYVDRGPESRQVIEHLMAAQAAGAPLICLKGNHEDMMHETLTAPLDPNWWVGNGGETTLKSYGGVVSPEHLHWVKNLPTTHIDKHRVFVHAGVDPTKPLDEQTEEFMLWYRYVDNADIGHGDRHVVHGHTPNPHGPEKYQNRTNLDTLAWRTGRLVVAVFDDAKPGAAIGYIEVKKS
jgi:serine/threonine protein phosphatase 1